jgi:hypothetical protein
MHSGMRPAGWLPEPNHWLFNTKDILATINALPPTGGRTRLMFQA